MAITMALNEIRLQHIHAQSLRFDRSINRLIELLSENRLRRCVELLLTSHEQILYNVFAVADNYKNQFGLTGYNYGYGNPLSKIEFTNSFVGYDLLDDGDPGICYHVHITYLDSDDPRIKSHCNYYVLCDKSEPHSEPFICKRVEVARATTGFNYELCNASDVVDILCKYEFKRRRDLLKSSSDMVGTVNCPVAERMKALLLDLS